MWSGRISPDGDGKYAHYLLYACDPDSEGSRPPVWPQGTAARGMNVRMSGAQGTQPVYYGAQTPQYPGTQAQMPQYPGMQAQMPGERYEAGLAAREILERQSANWKNDVLQRQEALNAQALAWRENMLRKVSTMNDPKKGEPTEK